MTLTVTRGRRCTFMCAICAGAIATADGASDVAIGQSAARQWVQTIVCELTAFRGNLLPSRHDEDCWNGLAGNFIMIVSLF